MIYRLKISISYPFLDYLYDAFCSLTVRITHVVVFGTFYSDNSDNNNNIDNNDISKLMAAFVSSMAN